MSGLGRGLSRLPSINTLPAEDSFSDSGMEQILIGPLSLGAANSWCFMRGKKTMKIEKKKKKNPPQALLLKSSVEKHCF